MFELQRGYRRNKTIQSDKAQRQASLKLQWNIYHGLRCSTNRSAQPLCELTTEGINGLFGARQEWPPFMLHGSSVKLNDANLSQILNQ